MEISLRVWRSLVEPLRLTKRLSESERAMLMGTAESKSGSMRARTDGNKVRVGGLLAHLEDTPAMIEPLPFTVAYLIDRLREASGVDGSRINIYGHVDMA